MPAESSEAGSDASQNEQLTSIGVYEEEDIDFMSNRDDAQEFIGLLKLYGEKGVVLRELITLASVCTLNPFSKETAPSARGTFLRSFAICACRRDNLVKLQNELLASRLITVVQAPSPATGCWTTDSQIWIAAQTSETYLPERDYILGEMDRQTLCLHLIQALASVPERSDPYLADRWKEYCYGH